jgi:hypothetical protein
LREQLRSVPSYVFLEILLGSLLRSDIATGLVKPFFLENTSTGSVMIRFKADLESFIQFEKSAFTQQKSPLYILTFYHRDRNE